MQLLRKANSDPAALSKAMADGGIGFLVTGEILPGTMGMTLTARISQTKEGRDIASRRVDGLSKEALIRAADQIALAVKKGLNLPTTEGVDAYSADYASAIRWPMRPTSPDCRLSSTTGIPRRRRLSRKP